jgi:hypothetical protein
MSKCPCRDLNRGPSWLKESALPTELSTTDPGCIVDAMTTRPWHHFGMLPIDWISGVARHQFFLFANLGPMKPKTGVLPTQPPCSFKNTFIEFENLEFQRMKLTELINFQSTCESFIKWIINDSGIFLDLT